jgi:uncharacterized membrane protein
MHMEPLWQAGPVIAGHAIAAFAPGLVQLALPKGAAAHVRVGRTWVVLLVLVAGSSLAISEIGTFGYLLWIHPLAIVTALGLRDGMRAIRRGAVRAHAATMISVFRGALVIAGAFTFLPHRVMEDVATGRGTAE